MQMQMLDSNMHSPNPISTQGHSHSGRSSQFNIFPDPELWEVVLRLFGERCGAAGKTADAWTEDQAESGLGEAGKGISKADQTGARGVAQKAGGTADALQRLELNPCLRERGSRLWRLCRADHPPTAAVNLPSARLIVLGGADRAILVSRGRRAGVRLAFPGQASETVNPSHSEK